MAGCDPAQTPYPFGSTQQESGREQSEFAPEDQSRTKPDP